jgi:hypothetical protein
LLFQNFEKKKKKKKKKGEKKKRAAEEKWAAGEAVPAIERITDF